MCYNNSQTSSNNQHCAQSFPSNPNYHNQPYPINNYDSTQTYWLQQDSLQQSTTESTDELLLSNYHNNTFDIVPSLSGDLFQPEEIFNLDQPIKDNNNTITRSPPTLLDLGSGTIHRTYQQIKQEQTSCWMDQNQGMYNEDSNNSNQSSQQYDMSFDQDQQYYQSYEYQQFDCFNNQSYQSESQRGSGGVFEEFINTDLDLKSQSSYRNQQNYSIISDLDVPIIDYPMNPMGMYSANMDNEVLNTQVVELVDSGNSQVTTVLGDNNPFNCQTPSFVNSIY